MANDKPKRKSHKRKAYETMAVEFYRERVEAMADDTLAGRVEATIREAGKAPVK